MERWDAVVIGGGVAGLSAALVLGRARRRTLVLDLGGQSNRVAHHVGGMLGYDGTPPAELYALAREQVDAYPDVTLLEARADAVRRDEAGFALATDRAGEQHARVLILAAGADYEVPELPGFRDHWGGLVFHCPFCHGWGVRDQHVVVCGTGEKAQMQATLIRGWTDEVSVVEPDDVTGLRADGSGAILTRRDGTEIACGAVMVHAPVRPRASAIVDALGLTRTDDGRVEAGPHGQTSAPGVYAAGDVAIAPQQVALALASGHAAGLGAVRELIFGP